MVAHDAAEKLAECAARERIPATARQASHRDPIKPKREFSPSIDDALPATPPETPAPAASPPPLYDRDLPWSRFGALPSYGEYSWKEDLTSDSEAEEDQGSDYEEGGRARKKVKLDGKASSGGSEVNHRRGDSWAGDLWLRALPDAKKRSPTDAAKRRLQLCELWIGPNVSVKAFHEHLRRAANLAGIEAWTSEGDLQSWFISQVSEVKFDRFKAELLEMLWPEPWVEKDLERCPDTAWVVCLCSAIAAHHVKSKLTASRVQSVAPSSSSSPMPSPALLRSGSQSLPDAISTALSSGFDQPKQQQPMRHLIEELFQGTACQSMEQRMEALMKRDGLPPPVQSASSPVSERTMRRYAKRPLALPPTQPKQTSQMADTGLAVLSDGENDQDVKPDASANKQPRISQIRITQQLVPLCKLLELCNSPPDAYPIPRLALHLLNSGLSIRSMTSLSRTELHDIMMHGLSYDLHLAAETLVAGLAKEYDLHETPPLFNAEQMRYLVDECDSSLLPAALHRLLNSWHVVDFLRSIEAEWARWPPTLAQTGDHLHLLEKRERTAGVELTLAERAVLWHRIVAWNESLWELESVGEEQAMHE